MNKLLITLGAAVLFAGCGPEDRDNAAARNAAAASAAAEQRATQERQHTEMRIHEQEARTSRWQFAAMLALSGSVFALIIGTILGSRARHDSEK